MYIYLDLFILNNFIINLFLLLVTSYITKKKTNLPRCVAGALTGTLSIFMIFFEFNDIYTLILKFVFAKLMIFITFRSSYKGYIKIFTVFYLISFTLSGITLCLNYSFGKVRAINITTLITGCVLLNAMLFLSIKSLKKRIYESNLYKNVTIVHNNKKVTLTGFVDTGNNLIEPVSGLPVIIAQKKDLTKMGIIKTFPIMCRTVSGNGIINVFKPEKIIINNTSVGAYVGICENLNNDNFSVLLNNNMRRLDNAS